VVLKESDWTDRVSLTEVLSMTFEDLSTQNDFTPGKLKVHYLWQH